MGNWMSWGGNVDLRLNEAIPGDDNELCLSSVFRTLCERSPAFPIDAESVTIINHAPEFYEAIKAGIKNSQRRVVLASLYLGTGEHEQELVKLIDERLENEAAFEAYFLFDGNRGTRGAQKQNSTSTLLAKLVAKYPDRVHTGFFMSPTLSKFWRTILPERYNEGMGVQHIKIYLFDDDVLMSGANLSDWYFVDRQDRYMLLRNCAELAQFLFNLVTTIQSFSLPVNKHGLLKDSLPVNNHRTSNYPIIHPFKDANQFKKAMREKVIELISSNVQSSKELNQSTTWVFPLIQMGILDIVQDEIITKYILGLKGADTYLSSAYFNITQEYEDILLKKCPPDSVTIITSAPTANGFYNSAGISKHIPTLYSELEQRFSKRVVNNNKQDVIHLYEWETIHNKTRDSKVTQNNNQHNYQVPTYHAKGLWLYSSNNSNLPPSDENLPVLSMVGSPNFGYRSTLLDLETQLVVLSTDKNLRMRLHQERLHLFKDAAPIKPGVFSQPHRYAGMILKCMTSILKKYM